MADKFTESLFQAVHDSVQRARDELGNLGDAPARFQESVEEYWTM